MDNIKIKFVDWDEEAKSLVVVFERGDIETQPVTIQPYFFEDKDAFYESIKKSAKDITDHEIKKREFTANTSIQNEFKSLVGETIEYDVTNL